MSATQLDDETLEEKGLPPGLRAEGSGWVPVAYKNERVDEFDAFFWGIGVQEATIMDPQQRRFLQTAWSAVEHSGHAPRSGTPTRSSVFAACGIDGYLIHHQDGGALKTPADPGALFLTEVGNEKNYIATATCHAHGRSQTDTCRL